MNHAIGVTDGPKREVREEVGYVFTFTFQNVNRQTHCGRAFEFEMV